MCNIAGYAGNQQAAPILLEMLRKQEPYDGDMSTGVATIHEGKLYYQKLVGNVENFLKNVDLSLLPGTIGIAHTRPGADQNGVPPHPQISKDQRTALVTNGTSPRTKYWDDWDAAVQLLADKGYEFFHESENPQEKSPKLKNGHYVFPVEARVHLVDMYLKEGKSAEEAVCLSSEKIYCDKVTVFLTEYAPHQITVNRTTPPMVCVMEKDATYISTSRFGLPEEIRTEAFDLPLFYGIGVKRDGITVSKPRMNVEEPVADMTPYTYSESYKRVEALLKSEQAPLYFDELESAVGKMRDLWPGDHTYVQHARLVYDLLWQFDREGRLRRVERVQQRAKGLRRRYYMWLED